MNDNNAIHEAANAIINARDLCGDERGAAVEALRDAGVEPTARRIGQAFFEASGEWIVWQRGAGVTQPIGRNEWAAIHRALEG